MKLYILFVVCVVSFVKFIDGSCMSYGHSCWGAHGKRSNIPPINEQDRYAIADGMFPFKKVMRDNSIQQLRYTDNGGPQPSYDEEAFEKMAKINSPDELFDDSDEFQQQRNILRQRKRAKQM